MNKEKFLSLIGLAQKAGKIVSGEVAVELAVKAGKVKVLILANDASDNARKMYQDMCVHYNIPLQMGLSKEELGAAVGKGRRAAIAVTDDGFSRIIQASLGQ